MTTMIMFFIIQGIYIRLGNLFQRIGIAEDKVAETEIIRHDTA